MDTRTRRERTEGPAAASRRPDRAPRRWTLSRQRQVSWLAGQRGRSVFPGLPPV